MDELQFTSEEMEKATLELLIRIHAQNAAIAKMIIAQQSDGSNELSDLYTKLYQSNARTVFARTLSHLIKNKNKGIEELLTMDFEV